MKIGTNGIVINQLGQVLLIQRNDSRTYAPPGGGLEAGELPTDNVAREVREETGLIVMPVRLVGVYYWPVRPTGLLGLVFRCIQRGGELKTSSESIKVGYHWPRKLPRPMAGFHKERVQQAIFHEDLQPYWGHHGRSRLTGLGYLVLTKLIYPLFDLRRKLRDQPPFIPAPQWDVSAVTIIRDQEGSVLWLQQPGADVWRLPGGWGEQMEAPWETAVRHTHNQSQLQVKLEKLTGIYTHAHQPQITFSFTAAIQEGRVPTSTEFTYFAPGAEPENAHPDHVAQIADVTRPGEKTICRFTASTITAESD